MPLVVYSRPKSAILWVRGSVAGQSVRENLRRLLAPSRRSSTAPSGKPSCGSRRSTARKRSGVRAGRRQLFRGPARSDRDKARIAALLEHFGEDCRLADIKQEFLPEAYAAILRDGKDASAATKLRAVHAPLRAIIEHAALSNMCERPKFKAPRVVQAPTYYLKPHEATRLVEAAVASLRPLLIFLIGTGCRMAEALELEWDRVDLRGARAVVWQKQQNERQVDCPRSWRRRRRRCRGARVRCPARISAASARRRKARGRAAPTAAARWAAGEEGMGDRLPEGRSARALAEGRPRRRGKRCASGCPSTARTSAATPG